MVTAHTNNGLDGHTSSDAETGESATEILFITMFVLSTISLIATSLVTLSTFITYVSGNTASVARDESTLDIPVPSLFRPDEEAPSIGSAPVLVLPDPEANASRPPPVVAPAPAVNMPQVPQAKLEQSASWEPMPEFADAAVESVTTQPALVQQEDLPRHGEPLITAESGSTPFIKEQDQCTGGFLRREICREAIRWTYCHPDKWDQVSECIVGKL
jgi:hypothetical protein